MVLGRQHYKNFLCTYYKACRMLDIVQEEAKRRLKTKLNDFLHQ